MLLQPPQLPLCDPPCLLSRAVFSREGRAAPLLFGTALVPPQPRLPQTWGMHQE